MECKIAFYFILLSYFSAALPTKEKSSYHTFSHSYDYVNENSLFGDENSKKPETSTKQNAKYEVTELIQDIPDDRTVGPIHTNYMTQRPLNIASTRTPRNRPEERYDEKDKNGFEEDDVKEDLDSEDESNISDIKEYFNGIKKGIVNCFKNIVHIHREEDDDDVEEPLSVLRKLHTKTAHVAQNVGKALFGGKFDDIFPL